MNRRRGITAEEVDEAVTLIPADGSGNPDTPDASQQWDEFEQFRDQGEGSTAGMHVWVYRIPTDMVGNPISNVDSALLFTAPIDVYTLPQIYDRVKKEYMPRGLGRALIRIQVRREKVRGVLWQKMIPIEKGMRDDEPTAVSSPANDSSNPAIAAIAQAMNQQNQLLARIFESRNNAPPRDVMADSRGVIEMVTGLAAVLSKGTAAPGPATNSLTDMIAAIREVRKLSVEMAPDGGGGGDADSDSLPGILAAGKPYVELLGQLIARAPAGPPVVRRQLPPPQLRQPNPTMGSASVIPPVAPPIYPNTTMGSAAVTPPTGDAMLLELAKHVSDICTLIEQGKAEPNGVAGLILDAVPEQFDDRFYGIVAAENWLEKLAAVEPRVRQHAEFFTQVRERIMQEFAEDAAPPATGG